MKINNIAVYHVQLPLVSPFQTSFGKFFEKDALIVQLATADGVLGYGECASLSAPLYSPDFTASDKMVMEEFFIPKLTGKEGYSITDFLDVFSPVRGHNFAKAGVEMAIYDALAKEAGMPLWRYIGGVREKVPCGISLGMLPSSDEEYGPVMDRLVASVGKSLQEGYQRIKIKIGPKRGSLPAWDIGPVRELRNTFGYGFPLMVDANSAFTLDDIGTLKELDKYNLLMIEQPLDEEDIYFHARIQKELPLTPICLDESIHTLEHAKAAVASGSCRIINIKIGRVGGIYNAMMIHDFANCGYDSGTGIYAPNIPLWVGGMLETGIGRAHNIALNSLKGFSMVGDVSPSRRFWKEDIVKDPAEMVSGHIIQRDSPGIGYEPDMAMLMKYQVKPMM